MCLTMPCSGGRVRQWKKPIWACRPWIPAFDANGGGAVIMSAGPASTPPLLRL